MREPPLRVLTLSKYPERAAVLKNGLRIGLLGKGDQTRAVELHPLSTDTSLAASIVAIDPDVLFLDLQTPDQRAFENMMLVCGAVDRPIAVFVDKSDAAQTELAINAGVSSYIVDGLKEERLPAILNLTLSRFCAQQKMRTELEETKAELNERKLIDRAKRVLMTRQNLTEDEAYSLMRRTAMSKSSRIVDVAQSMLMVADLIGDRR